MANVTEGSDAPAAGAAWLPGWVAVDGGQVRPVAGRHDRRDDRPTEEQQDGHDVQDAAQLPGFAPAEEVAGDDPDQQTHVEQDEVAVEPRSVGEREAGDRLQDHGRVTKDHRDHEAEEEGVVAGFAFDDSSISYLQNYRMPKNLQILRANIAADVLVPDLLKNRRGQQLFAVFGEPDVAVYAVGGGEFEAEVRGIDVYDPATGEVTSDTPDGIAAWFLDQDYDRRSFLISQAFFPGAGPGGDPWKRLSTALKGWVDPDQFELLRGTRSLPFRAEEQSRIAVKVIDFRGNEAIRILDLQ